MEKDSPRPTGTTKNHRKGTFPVSCSQGSMFSIVDPSRPSPRNRILKISKALTHIGNIQCLRPTPPPRFGLQPQKQHRCSFPRRRINKATKHNTLYDFLLHVLTFRSHFLRFWEIFGPLLRPWSSLGLTLGTLGRPLGAPGCPETKKLRKTSFVPHGPGTTLGPFCRPCS